MSPIAYEFFDYSMRSDALLCSTNGYHRSFAGQVCFAVFDVNFQAVLVESNVLEGEVSLCVVGMGGRICHFS